MDYVKPADLVASIAESGEMRAGLSISDLLIRGMLSGGLLGIATSLAITAAVQTGQAIVGAVIFPVGFVMIVVLGLELVTGNFGIFTVSAMAGRTGVAAVLRNWVIVFIGNLLGSVLYAAVLAVALTNAFTAAEVNPVAAKIMVLASLKTVGYAHIGTAGMVTAFAKGILCNWMVCMGVAMANASTSTFGKLFGAWLPILIFFGQGFEHAVVNMFLIPCAMMMGAPISMAQFWVWNELPVTLGNLVGGVIPMGMALAVTYNRGAARRHAVRMQPAE